jgi:hypothetical protein
MLLNFSVTQRKCNLNIHTYIHTIYIYIYISRSQWPRGQRCASAAARLLGLRVRIPPGAWMSVSCECCVLSGRGLCVGLITRPEEYYREWCAWEWSWSLDNEEALAHLGLLHDKKLHIYIYIYIYIYILQTALISYRIILRLVWM